MDKINIRSPYYLTTEQKQVVPPPPPPAPTLPQTVQVNCGDTWLTGIDVGSKFYELNTSETGNVDIFIGGNDVPVKFTLEWDGNSVTTGYIGLDTYDQQLIDAGVTIGEIATGDPSTKNTTLTINKTAATPTLVKLTVDAPLVNDSYSLEFDCPVPSVPTVECGAGSTYSGQEAYPSIETINLGSGTGEVELYFQAYTAPDKFIVEFDGVEVINTGYRGASWKQINLDNALAALGEPTETIQGTGVGTATFTKSTATTTATVKVYAPLPNTQWYYSLSCPE